MTVRALKEIEGGLFEEMNSYSVLQVPSRFIYMSVSGKIVPISELKIEMIPFIR